MVKETLFKKNVQRIHIEPMASLVCMTSPFLYAHACDDQEGGRSRGSGPLPLENHKNIGFLSTPYSHKATKPDNSGIWILPPLLKLKKKLVEAGPPLDPRVACSFSFLKPLCSQAVNAHDKAGYV